MTISHDPPARPLRMPGFVFDFDANELYRDDGERVPLRPQCLDVLRCLASRPGQVVGKEELMQAVWANLVVTDDSLIQCIHAVRLALCDSEHRVIQTEPKRGYRLVPLRHAPHAEPPANVPIHQEVRFARTDDGVRIAYATAGHGLPLVRAARWASHLEFDWDCLTEGPLLRRLAARYRLVRYDRRGQGMSDRQVPTGSVDEQVLDLKAVADAAGLSRFVVLGNGSGCGYAIRFAVRYPERVSRLVLLAGFARGVACRGEASQHPESRKAYLDLFRHHWDEENPVARQMVTSRHYPGVSREQAASHNELLRQACTAERITDVIAEDGRMDVSEDLARVACPTLVAHSPLDSVTAFAEGRLIAASIPGARLQVIDSVNRLPMPEEPAFEQLLNAIDAFIAEDGIPRRSADASAPAAPGRRPDLRLAGDSREPPKLNRRHG